MTKRLQIVVIAVLGLVMVSCHTGRKAAPTEKVTVDNTIHVGHGTGKQRKIIDEALTWVGTPYKYAGVEKGKGVDCSGMVMQVYLDVTGRKLPRNSAKQAEFCDSLSAEEVAMGDLVFFATGKDPLKVSHVGIVIDNDSFIHASSSKGVVVSKFNNPYYQQKFRMFGRIPEPVNDLATHEK